jgi:hypothetical protein
MPDNTVLTPPEVKDLKEFIQTVMTICDRDPALAIEIEGLALTAAEILGMLDGEEDEDE